jgi:Ca2+-binding RTX toxin-like protein
LPSLDLPDDELLPSLTADLLLQWSWQANTTSGFGAIGTPDVLGFRDVELNLGEFINKFLGPVLKEVKRFTAPFQPVIDVVNAPIPGISDLSELLTGQQISMLTLFEGASGADLTMLQRILGIAQLVSAVAAAGDAGTVPIGEFDLNASLAVQRPVAASEISQLVPAGLQDLDSVVDQAGGIFSADALAAGGASSGAATAFTKSREGGGFSFPAFENPSQLFELIVGGDPTLALWESGVLRAGFGTSYTFPPIFVGPVPISIVLSMSASIGGQVGIGYDTYGVRRAVEAFIDGGGPSVGDSVSLLFQGVFLNDWDAQKVDVPEIVLSAEFAAGAGVTLGIVSAGLELGLRSTIDMNLRDNSGTGKVRIDQIIENFFTPICLFEVGGQIDIFMRAFLKFNFALFSKTFNFTIFEIALLRLNDILAGVCEPKPPNLADVQEGDNGKVLVVNVGARGDLRGVLPDKQDESVVVRPLNSDNTAFSVSAFGEYEEYGVPGGVEETPITGVSFQGRTIKVVADGGTDADEITMATGTKKELQGNPNDGQPIDETGIDNAAIPFTASVLICGGRGDDVITGGEGNDILVGDGLCPATVSDDDVNLSYDTTDHGDDDGADRIYGIGGNNLMLGLGGADQLYGGFDGGDTMIGGSGDDTIRADGENGSVLIGGSRINPDSAPTGVSQPGDDQLFGADAADVLIGDNGHVSGGTVYVDLSAGGDDVLEGGAGNDRLFGGRARDIMYGGAGNDYLDGGDDGDAVVGGVAADPNSPSTDDPGFNVVVGGRGNDHLAAHHAEVRRDDNTGDIIDVVPAGSASNAALAVGGSLYDTTSPGSDGSWGGDGGDLVVGDDVQPVNASHRPAQSASLVTYPSGLTASAFATLRGRDADGLPTGVETIDDNGGHDRLYGGGDNDSEFGGPGNDIVVGGRPVPRAATGSDLLVGGRGHDVLIGDNGRDNRTSGEVSANATPKVTLLAGPVPAATTVNRLIGGSVDDLSNPGNDWLYAGQYGDVMIGDNGKITAGFTADVYLTHGGNDHVFGSQGEDRGFGGPGEDVVRGGPARDMLEGGPDDDEVYGDSGDDILLGGTSRPGIPSGDDDLFGGFGVDALAGDNARIVLVTADGLHGTNYAVELFDLPLAGGSAPNGTAGEDVLSGGGGTDLLYGENGIDVLYGDEGDDFLQGGPDGDELYGGSGSDSLAGGNGLHVEFQDSWPLLPATEDVHRVPVPNAAVSFGFTDLAGHADSGDLVVGGTGPDGLAGDNAVVEQTGFGQFDVRLLDVEYADELPVPTGTSGSDVLIGGSIGDLANPGDDLGFGQGKADLLIGDNAAELADARLYAPLLHASDGDDHLEGGAGDDTVFAAGGSDRLLGGSSDLGIADAATQGVVAGNDVISGGPGDDYGLGDNGRIEQPAPWWSTGVGGESVTLFDEKIDGSGLPHPSTAGNDLLLGGSLRGNGAGLHGDQTEADSPGHDLLHGQASNDLLFGDDITVDVTDWTGGWHAIRPDTSLPMAQWQIATLDWVVDGSEAADGGDDLILGGPDDDIAFGGPAQDDILGGSWQGARHDGRDLVDGGPSHDVVAGDNATILRQFEDATFTCQTYRHRHGDVAAWEAATSGGFEFDCAVGTPDSDPGNGVYTRVVRAAEMLDQTPGVTSGSDLVWGNYGDDDITGQFDDTAEFTAETWAGLPAWRLVEWCRLDAHLAALIAADALDVAELAEGDTMADYLAYYGFDIDDVAAGGDALCGAAGEDAVLGDQGVVVDIVEDGGREAVIAPQQPFMEALIFAEGTLTRQVELSQRVTGGADVVLGGDDGDWLHGGAGNDLINGNFGDDRIFGDDNDDALWGGAGNDHSYGGNHADDLDIRPRLSKPASEPGNPNQPPEHPGDPAERFLVAVEGDGYDGIDHLYGGWHRDVMQANEGDNGPVNGDRAIDWGGVYNLWYNCPATYGAWIDIRSPYPGLEQYLIDQAAGDGALDPGTPGSSGFDELALVYQKDIQQNTNPPHPETPGHFTCGAADGT